MIEVTEDSFIADPERARQRLLELSDMHVQAAIDDYGTGFSSLSYLRDLPVRELKMDRSFIATLLSDPSSRVIVDTTTKMAHALGLRLVAEGVEDAATAARWSRWASTSCRATTSRRRCPRPRWDRGSGSGPPASDRRRSSYRRLPAPTDTRVGSGSTGTRTSRNCSVPGTETPSKPTPRVIRRWASGLTRRCSSRICAMSA